MRIVALGAILLVVCAGCGTMQSTKAKPLPTAVGSSVDLRSYTIATILPFENPNRNLEHPDPAQMMANSLTRRLRADFGPLFDQVRNDAPLGQQNEVIITGIIQEYEPGSRFVRALGPGLGAAKFKAELHLKDGATGQTLVVAPIDKLWAWGHSIGALKGIEDMIEESAAAAAATIARAKGWQPPS